MMVSSLTRLYLIMSFNIQFDIYTDDIDSSGAVGVCKRLSFRSAATFNIQTLTQPYNHTLTHIKHTVPNANLY